MAHSDLRASIPDNGARLRESPSALELTFSEKVQVTAIRLFRDDGREITLERPRAADAVSTHRSSLPKLEEGAYRVEWRIISADGHPVGGVLRFTIRSNP